MARYIVAITAMTLRNILGVHDGARWTGRGWIHGFVHVEYLASGSSLKGICGIWQHDNMSRFRKTLIKQLEGCSGSFNGRRE